jgi:hypothetical protein
MRARWRVASASYLRTGSPGEIIGGTARDGFDTSPNDLALRSDPGQGRPRPIGRSETQAPDRVPLDDEKKDRDRGRGPLLDGEFLTPLNFQAA